MYWQVKAFFCVLVVALLAGGVFVAWPYLPKPSAKRAPAAPEDTAAVVPDGVGEQPSAPIARSSRPSAPTALPERHAAKLTLARSFIQTDPVKARNLAENVLKDPDLTIYSGAWWQVTGVLGEINTRILFSDCPCEDKADYVVKSGDTIAGISKRYQTTYSLIRRGNRLAPEDQIYPEQTLRIYQGNFNIRVSKSNYALLLFDAERLIKAYHIGIGKENRTPEGAFIVKAGGKQKDPDWWYRGRKIPANDPENPLGTRWMALAGTDQNTVTLRGYGIHGTTERDSIGKDSSNGCVRMLNEEVEELYDIVPEGIPVVIEK